MNAAQKTAEPGTIVILLTRSMGHILCEWVSGGIDEGTVTIKSPVRIYRMMSPDMVLTWFHDPLIVFSDTNEIRYLSEDILAAIWDVNETGKEFYEITNLPTVVEGNLQVQEKGDADKEDADNKVIPIGKRVDGKKKGPPKNTN